MTNLEKYRCEIESFIFSGNDFGMKDNGEIEKCTLTPCSRCIFQWDDTCNCRDNKLAWLHQEYEEPKEPEVDWSKVPVDTPILVSMLGDCEWHRKHFAEFKNGFVYAWNYGCTSWTAERKVEWNYAKLAEQEGGRK